MIRLSSVYIQITNKSNSVYIDFSANIRIESMALQEFGVFITKKGEKLTLYADLESVSELREPEQSYEENREKTGQKIEAMHNLYIAQSYRISQSQLEEILRLEKAEFGKLIQLIRLARGLRAIQFLPIQIHQPGLSDIETGKSKPRRPKIIRLLNFLGFTADSGVPLL